MTNPITASRQKKLQILKECLLAVIDLLQLHYVERDRIHMARFKRLRDLVYEIRKEANLDPK